MGLWDTLKGLFGLGGGEEPHHARRTGPGLGGLPPIEWESYDPTLRYVACTGSGRKVHLGYINRRGPAIHIFCQGQHSADFKEVRGGDIADIDCKRCQKRIARLQDPTDPIVIEAEKSSRYENGTLASCQKADGEPGKVHVAVIPEGEEVGGQKPICGEGAKMTLTPVEAKPDDKEWVTCGRCRGNFHQLPRRFKRKRRR